MGGILPRTACEADLHMDDSFNEVFFSPRCGHFQKRQWEYYLTASWVPYHEQTLRDTSNPLVRSKG